jgi:TadE-like protein
MKRRGEWGGSLAEMALVMVALLSLIFGIIEFGRLLYTYSWLTDVAQAAVRWGIVRGTDCSLLDHCNVGLNTHSNYVPSWVVGQDVGIVNPAGVGVSCDYSLQGAPGSSIVCNVNYTFHFMLPFMPQTPSGAGIPLQTTAKMYFTN